MLLEFRAKNYKQFVDELVFSMKPAPKQKGLDYSILQAESGSRTYKALSTAVIYGPNAAGKTNLIGAMEVFKEIVLRGNIRNGVYRNEPNAAVQRLELIPSVACTERVPVEFAIHFWEQGLFFEYELSLDLGFFMEEDYDRNIVQEVLRVNDKLIFSRQNELSFGDLTAIHEYWVNGFADSKEGAVTLAKNNLHNEELFLNNGFKTMFSAKLVQLVNNWLEKKFMVFCRADAIETIKHVSNPVKHIAYIDKPFNDAARIFGVTANELGFLFHDDDDDPARISILDSDNALQAEVFESLGTIRFMNLFPLLVRALLMGGTLIIDEFDASIHPMALMSLVNIFHNDDINKHKAQLIFNTHNPIFLNANLFRRDEIKFIERDEDTHQSVHYSLSDFGTSGEKGVRKHEDYMKNYFVSRYGAIREVDFTPVFEKIMQDVDGAVSDD
ncbi:ATP-binding protein [Paenibacillus athensensis]|uniref:Abortive phage infection protein n=1 Tax=Paenibacillus athensensis TaxID=1967502 RepID=A0A4Y8PTA0_9BACL|nr:ATP-binding protein [Paenibacillus athensensis]MCD1261312.1 ATP-binding protein [Paenibacillus athensensis]